MSNTSLHMVITQKLPCGKQLWVIQVYIKIQMKDVSSQADNNNIFFTLKTSENVY